MCRVSAGRPFLVCLPADSRSITLKSTDVIGGNALDGFDDGPNSGLSLGKLKLIRSA